MTPKTIEEVILQILNKRSNKKLAKSWNIESKNESKEFTLNAAITICYEKMKTT